MLAIEHRSTSNFIFGASNTKSKIACFKIFHVWPTKWLRPQLRWPGAPQWQRRIFTTNQAPSFFSLTPLVGHHRFKEDHRIIWMALCCLRNFDDIALLSLIEGRVQSKTAVRLWNNQKLPTKLIFRNEKKAQLQFFLLCGRPRSRAGAFFDTQMVWWCCDCGALVRYDGGLGGAGLEQAMRVVVVVVLLLDMVVLVVVVLVLPG